MKYKTKEEIQYLKEGGVLLSGILETLLDEVRPGVTTGYLDEQAQKKIQECGGKPSFLGYGAEYGNPFPGALCTSINEEVVHGIPSKDRVIREGDIVSLDIGMWYKGLATDMARTKIVGSVPKDVSRLVSATRESLEEGIAVIRPGATLRDFARAVEAVAKREHLGVVRDLVGHGVGHKVHEPPQIANYEKGASDMVFEEGMVVALEPMFTLGSWKVRVLEDGWTFVTADGSLSAHFEDTVAVMENGVEIITH
jgi:methionyl aminopeptidase